MIRSVEEAITWLRHTFFYIRVRENPIFYGFSSFLNRDQLEKELQKLCCKAIEDLNAAGVIVYQPDNQSIAPLPEAHHMTKHLIRLSSMVILMKLATHSTIYEVNI